MASDTIKVRRKGTEEIYSAWKDPVFDCMTFIVNDGRVPSRTASRLPEKDFWEVFEPAPQN